MFVEGLVQVMMTSVFTTTDTAFDADKDDVI